MVNKPENILNNVGITLSNTEALVRQENFLLTEISRNGNRVTLKGKSSALENAEEITIISSVRAILYLNTKTEKRVTPFGKAEFKNFIKQTEGQITLKPKYSFFVNVLIHNESGLGYALTFKRLVPLNKNIFDAYLKGEIPKSIPKLFPYFMGTSVISTKSGKFEVNFGVLNGNCGIKITNPQRVQVGLSAKHLPNSVYAMCAKIAQMAKSEAVQNAQTSQELTEILEGFKGATL